MRNKPGRPRGSKGIDIKNNSKTTHGQALIAAAVAQENDQGKISVKVGPRTYVRCFPNEREAVIREWSQRKVV